MHGLFSVSSACILLVGSCLQPSEQDILTDDRYVPHPCDRMEDALPILKTEGKKQTPEVKELDKDRPRRACDVHVAEKDCASWHAAWECHSMDENTCRCSFGSVCHGIAALLQPVPNVQLLCRPDEVHTMCTCRGFKACPEKGSAEWECHLDRTSKPPMPPHKRKDGSSQAEQQYEASVLKNSSLCNCKATSPLYSIRLSEKEREDLFSREPLQEAMSFRKPEQQTGVARKDITNMKKEADRVHLDIKDHKEPDKKEEDSKDKDTPKDVAVVAAEAKQKEDTASDADADSKLVEHCVVTDGWPRFTDKHWMMMGVMLAPMWAVALYVLVKRWRASSAVAQDLATGGGPGSSQSGSRRESIKSLATSNSGEAVVDTPVAEEESRRPPFCAYYSIVALLILLKLNLTVIVSSSHLITAQGGSANLELDEKHGDSELGGSISGLLIAAEPLGGLIGILLVARSGLGQPRELFVGGCLMVCLGSMGFFLALQYNSMLLMLTVRALSGISEGCVFLGQTYLAFLSSNDVRTEIFATCEFGTAAGLAAGPVLTSIFGFRGSLAAVAGLALLLLCILILSFPENEELGAEQIADRESKLPCWKMDDDMDDPKWVAAFVSWTSAATRPMLRLAWESSAVMVLSAHFCLGYKITGYLIALVILFYLIAQTVFVRVCSRMSDHRLVRRCESLELIGLIMMLRWPGTLDYAMQHDVQNTWSAFNHIALFTLASGFIYSGNCLLAAPMNAWSTKLGPRKSCVLLYNNIAVQVGSFAGSYLSRFFAGWDPHQNTLALMIIPLVLSHGMLSETAFTTMRFIRLNRTLLEPDPAA